MKTTITETCKCYKCDGSGFIRAFAGIANGVCFTCGGSGNVKFRMKREDKFSPINAMHTTTLAEAQAFRLAEFAKRFPSIVLTDRDEWLVKNGCGKLKDIVAAYGI